jgi:hypothetical protein
MRLAKKSEEKEMLKPHYPTHGSHIAGELLIAQRSGVSDSELEGVYNGHGGQ